MYAYGSCSAVLTSNMICNMALDCQIKFQSFTWFDKNMTLKVNEFIKNPDILSRAWCGW